MAYLSEGIFFLYANTTWRTGDLQASMMVEGNEAPVDTKAK